MTPMSAYQAPPALVVLDPPLQKVIMLNRQFKTEWNSFKQDPKKTAAIFLKCDAGEVRTSGPLVLSLSRKKFVNFNKATLLFVTQNPIKPICTVSS